MIAKSVEEPIVIVLGVGSNRYSDRGRLACGVDLDDRVMLLLQARDNPLAQISVAAQYEDAPRLRVGQGGLERLLLPHQAVIVLAARGVTEAQGVVVDFLDGVVFDVGQFVPTLVKEMNIEERKFAIDALVLEDYVAIEAPR